MTDFVYVLTNAAMPSLVKIGVTKGRNWTAIQGPAYWKHEGRTLADLRSYGEEGGDE